MGFGVGLGVGLCVGFGVGLVVGECVGFGVGFGVGYLVGSGVGFGVGICVGFGVGYDVGLGVGVEIGGHCVVPTSLAARDAVPEVYDLKSAAEYETVGVTDVACPSIAFTMSDADNSDGHSSKEWIFPGKFSVSEYRANTVISSPKVVSDATYR